MVGPKIAQQPISRTVNSLNHMSSGKPAFLPDEGISLPTGLPIRFFG
jgi:hypothetical protein